MAIVIILRVYAEVFPCFVSLLSEMVSPPAAVGCALARSLAALGRRRCCSGALLSHQTLCTFGFTLSVDTLGWAFATGS